MTDHTSEWSYEALHNGVVGGWGMHFKAPFSPSAAVAVAACHLAEAIHRDRTAAESRSADDLTSAETAWRIAIERWQRLIKSKRIRRHMTAVAATRGLMDPAGAADTMLRGVLSDVAMHWLLHDGKDLVGRMRARIAEELRTAGFGTPETEQRYLGQLIQAEREVGRGAPHHAALGLARYAATVTDEASKFSIAEEIAYVLDLCNRSPQRARLAKVAFGAARVAIEAVPEHYGLRVQLARTAEILGAGDDGSFEIVAALDPYHAQAYRLAQLKASYDHAEHLAGVEAEILDLIAWRLGLDTPLADHRHAMSALLENLEIGEKPARIRTVIGDLADSYPQLQRIDIAALASALATASEVTAHELFEQLPGRWLVIEPVDEASRERIVGLIDGRPRPLRNHRAELRHWVASRRDWLFKLGAVAGLVLCVVGVLALRGAKDVSARRASAYADVISAANTGKTDELHLAASRFLDATDVGDSDARLARVTEMFGQSLSAELGHAIETRDEARLATLIERSKKLAPYLDTKATEGHQ